MSAGWQFWIDRGGTFTDVVARRPNGTLVSQKRLSENADPGSDPVLEAIRDFLGVAPDARLPTEQIDAVKMGTTVATNALLERTGEPTVLCITEGFADALQIGFQNRPDIFALNISLPAQLYGHVIEVRERMDVHGSVRTPLDERALYDALSQAREDGYRACAIALVHGYLYPGHEQRTRELARELGFEQVSVSHQVSPLRKLVCRGDTTVADAYLSPVLSRKIASLSSALEGTRLFFMQSNGGLSDAANFAGKDAIISGPAGGIVGAARACEEVGFEKIIAFDMGGTSTDVAHYAGELERITERTIAGVRLSLPMLDIHTIAAGGGSVARYEQGRLRVGPQSAGAAPGPACYGKAGPLTLTDCNVVLGRIRGEYFPKLFGPEGKSALDIEAALARIDEVLQELRSDEQQASREEIASGFLTIAVDHMANAIKQISLQRGKDTEGYALCSFGGAGGQHACLVAERLGIQKIVVPPLTSVLSALGIGLADLRSVREQAVDVPLTSAALTSLEPTLAQLQDALTDTLERQGAARDSVEYLRRAKLQYEGSDLTLEVIIEGAEAMQLAFEREHRERFGFIVAKKKLRVASVSVEGVAARSSQNGTQPPGDAAPIRRPPSISDKSVIFYSKGKMRDARAWARNELGPGDVVEGPALIVETDTTTVVERDWSAEVLHEGHLVLTCAGASSSRTTLSEGAAHEGEAADPILLELFNNLFRATAEQMGVTLSQAAHSVNIKERMDFSCAVFDAEGALVANAPHVPVHLGSMGASVRAILSDRANFKPGDAFALNDPYRGGTHLPDITVVTPIFVDAKKPQFFVASRGHHADVGGITPGSMPPTSSSVRQEGVLLTNFQIMREGVFQEEAFVAAMEEGPHPARNIAQNIADIEAQIAANETGRRELIAMVKRYGAHVVRDYMAFVQQNAEASVRKLLRNQKNGHAIGRLDSGACVEVRVSIDQERGSALIDFSGTSEQQTSNFNAPRAVCEAAVLYVFRTLIADDIPMNEGCLIPLELKIPERSLLSPEFPAAVVAGNVETSQLIANTLLRALGAVAESQSTMNNLTFGDGAHQYYETICGGAGAGKDFDGASAVHTHMTNSRITDVEVLEARHPVLLRRFRIRRGSGGEGQHFGGDGVVRQIEFLKPMTAAIVSGNRVVPPRGLAGGDDGAKGLNRIRRKDGVEQELGSVAQLDVQAGDVLTIETPGGGGFGVHRRQ